MKILGILEKKKDFWFLLFTSIFFFLLRLPSLFEPYWYGDEGIYQVLGMGIREGRLLYQGVWDNKPPLLYLLYAIFSSDQFTVRLISLIFGLFTVFIFFLLAKKLFNKDKIVYLTTAIFAFLFGLPLLEGNIANAENFMMPLILLAGLLIYKLAESDPAKFQISNLKFKIFLAGLLLSIAFLFKIVAIFDFMAFFVFIFFIIAIEKKPLKTIIYNYPPFLFGFFLPILLTSLFFLFNGIFPDFLKATFGQNIGYVGYGNKFIIPQGLLLLKLFLLGLFLILLFIKKRVTSKPTIFILVWFAFSLFNAFFSQRPYTHYLLVLLPSFILFLGLFMSSVRKRTYIASLLFLIIILSKNFTVYGKTPFYYQNFLSFLLGNKDASSYQAFFDRNTPKDYLLASFIKSHTNQKDSIFIWGNNAQVYKLVNKLPPGRFTVLYHITASEKYLKETKEAVINSNPKYIIQISKKDPIFLPLNNYSQRINIGGYQIYERIF